MTIRAIRPEDKERIVKAFRALEPGSVYLRFFAQKKEVSGKELQRITEPDGVRHVVLVATTGSGDQETIIGLGEYARHGPGAEVAFVVEEDYRGRGIATRLLQQLARIGRENAIPRFEADVLEANAPMLSVLRDSGLPLRESLSDGIVHVTLLLSDDPRVTREGPA